MLLNRQKWFSSFFEEVASQDKVSIIKVDNGDEAVKAGVFDKETFPYQEFGLTSLDFFKEWEGSLQ